MSFVKGILNSSYKDVQYEYEFTAVPRNGAIEIYAIFPDSMEEVARVVDGQLIMDHTHLADYVFQEGAVEDEMGDLDYVPEELDRLIKEYAREEGLI